MGDVATISFLGITLSPNDQLLKVLAPTTADLLTPQALPEA